VGAGGGCSSPCDLGSECLWMRAVLLGTKSRCALRATDHRVCLSANITWVPYCFQAIVEHAQHVTKAS